MVPRTGGKAVPYARISKQTDLGDKDPIHDWKVRLLLRWLEENRDFLDRVRSIAPGCAGEAKQLDRLAEDIHEAAGGNEKSRRGDRLHEITERMDTGLPVTQYRPEELLLASAYLLGTLDLETVHAELFVVNDAHQDAGTLDRLYRYTGPSPVGRLTDELIVGDLKTGRMQYLPAKTAAQVADYADGEVYDHTVFPPVDHEDTKARTAWRKIMHDPDLSASARTPLGANREVGLLLHLDPVEGVLTKHWLMLDEGRKAAEVGYQRKLALARPSRYIKPWVEESSQV